MISSSFGGEDASGGWVVGEALVDASVPVSRGVVGGVGDGVGSGFGSSKISANKSSMDSLMPGTEICSSHRGHDILSPA